MKKYFKLISNNWVEIKGYKPTLKDRQIILYDKINGTFTPIGIGIY